MPAATARRPATSTPCWPRLGGVSKTRRSGARSRPMNEARYLVLESGAFPLYACNDCGTLAFAPERHDAWHDAQPASSEERRRAREAEMAEAIDRAEAADEEHRVFSREEVAQ